MKFLKIGEINFCPNCGSMMDRRKHKKLPKNKAYYFSEWDYCPSCTHTQHYEKYKIFVNTQIFKKKSFSSRDPLEIISLIENLIQELKEILDTNGTD